MLKEIVKYTDYNDNPQVATLYFNINRTELAERLELIDRVNDMARSLEGPQRELNTAEKQAILDLVKEFMELAYGVRSADGSLFTKTHEDWHRFRYSMAYDEFLMSLFMDAEKAFGFILAVCPKELREKAQETAKQEGLTVPQYESNATAPVQDSIPEDTRPIWVRENREPTNEELRNAPREELLLAMQRRNSVQS